MELSRLVSNMTLAGDSRVHVAMGAFGATVGAQRSVLALSAQL
jgi:hypothetical protein